MAGLIEELKRRNVIRVGLAYVVLSWLLLQVGDVLFEALRLPDWAITMLLAFLALGFIPAVIFSWVYELTPEGIKRESEIDRSQSITGDTGQRLNIMIVVLLVGAIALFAFDRFFPEAPPPRDDTAGPVGRPGVAARPEAVEMGSGTFSDAENVPDPISGPFSDAESVPDPISETERSIAVLPFANLSSDPENEYFADGLSEEILNILAQVPDLKVAGRTSSFAFKGRNEDLREIGRTLGVATILEGSVRRQGDRVRATAQLIRTSDGIHLWSEAYDRTLEDIFAIQDDIAQNVAGALSIVLDDDARARMERTGIRNVDAYLSYQRGMELYIDAHGTSPLLATLVEAEAHFDEALALAPNYSAAWFARSDYYAHLLQEFGVSTEERRRAQKELFRSLAQASEHAQVPSFKASIDVDRIIFSDDWSALRPQIQRAIEADGCPAPNWIELGAILGLGEGFVDYWKRRVECDPLNPVAPSQLATILAIDGRYEESAEVVASAREALGDYPILVGRDFSSLMLQGRFEEAAALGDTIREDDDFTGVTSRVLPLAAMGRLDEARAIRADFQERFGRPALTELEMRIALGEQESAFELAAELDQRPGGVIVLSYVVWACGCGEPWDLAVTPNFAERLREADVPWPPKQLIDYPAKGW